MNRICAFWNHYFDNHRVYGSPSYYVQKLFMQNQGDVLIEAEDDRIPAVREAPVLSCKIGMRTSRAQVEIRHFSLKVSGQESRTETIPDFTLSEENQYQDCLETGAVSYEITFTFQKKNGGLAENLEGQCSFDLEFAGRDDSNKLIWRIDGWQRLTSLYGMVDGKICDLGLYLFESDTDREYEARLTVEQNRIRTYIDGVLLCDHSCRSCQPESLYYSAVKDMDGTLIIKAVNVETAQKELHITWREAEHTYRQVEISAMEHFSLTDRNSFEEPEKVSPKDHTEYLRDTEFVYTLPGNSLTVFSLRE